MMPKPHERHVPDWFVTSLGVAVRLLLALSNGQREGWNSQPIVGPFIIFLVSPPVRLCSSLMPELPVDWRFPAPPVCYRHWPGLIADDVQRYPSSLFSAHV
jgi:hypothetical protein